MARFVQFCVTGVSAKPPVRHWLAFLRNHREAIAAMDFFTAPTLTSGVLYCFFIISHDRRRVLQHEHSYLRGIVIVLGSTLAYF
jgi:hypothetical protein